MLEIQNVSKLYKHNDQWMEVINNINLLIKKQEFIAFVGPSGCGKSTLLKIIAGLLASSSGKIILDEEEVSRPSKELGLVFQLCSL